MQSINQSINQLIYRSVKQSIKQSRTKPHGPRQLCVTPATEDMHASHQQTLPPCLSTALVQCSSSRPCRHHQPPAAGHLPAAHLQHLLPRRGCCTLKCTPNCTLHVMVMTTGQQHQPCGRQNGSRMPHTKPHHCHWDTHTGTGCLPT
jgi:hypothetical protein